MTTTADDAAPLAADAPSRKSRIIELLIVLAVTLGLDLWSKAWAWENLRNGESVTVIDKWAFFEFGFNTGAAFSFLKDASYARMFFITVTLLALVYMGRLAMTLPTKFRSAFWAVALVGGGAMGNLHDRLIRQMEIRGDLHYGVVDFIKVFYWEGKVWPTFNIADVALVVGVVLLFWFFMRHGDAVDGKAPAKGADTEAKPPSKTEPKHAAQDAAKAEDSEDAGVGDESKAGSGDESAPDQPDTSDDTDASESAKPSASAE